MTSITTSIKIIFLLCFTTVIKCQRWETTVIADIVFNIKILFRSTCICLLYNAVTEDEENKHFLIQIQKYLIQQSASSVIVSLNDMANRGYIKCYNNRPVNVLLSTSNETRRFLLQISTKLHLSDAIWLLFSKFKWDDTKSLNIFFNDIYIPIDTQFLITYPQEEGQTHILFSEVYRVSKTRSLRSNYFGTWTPNERIVETGVQFYERRNNLQGIVIKAASIMEPPVTILKRKEDNTYVVEGFFGKIWRSLEKTMNFTTEYSKPADDAWGSLTKNGTWNGMIGMILRNEVEIAVAEFTMTALRAGVVDFTIPLIDTRNCVLIRNPNAEEDISWLGFLEPFTSNLWIFVLTTIIVISLLLKLLYNLKLWYIGQVPPETIDTYSIIYIIGAFCSQGLNIDSGHSSLRILYFSAHLTALVLSAAYSAQLISFLSIQTFSLPFNSLRELIDIGTYKLGVLANSGQLNNFNTANDSLMKEVYTKLIEPDIENLPVSIEEGMQYICKYNKYAFMTSLDVVLGLLDHISCELMSVLGASIPESLAMSIKKRSPYRGLINFNLQAMRRNGVLKRLRQEEWPTKLPLPTSEWSSIDIYKTIPILFIIITGVILGMFLLTLEWCRHVNRKKRSRGNNRDFWSSCSYAIKQKMCQPGSNKVSNIQRTGRYQYLYKNNFMQN